MLNHFLKMPYTFSLRKEKKKKKEETRNDGLVMSSILRMTCSNQKSLKG